MLKNYSACIIFAVVWLIADLPCYALEKYQKILIISSQETEVGRNLSGNIIAAFKNLKLNYKNIDARSYEIGAELQRLERDDLLIVATNDFSALVCQSKIVRFVAEGGRALFPVLGTGGDALSNLVGVKNVGGSEIVSGFNSSVKLFPGLEESKLEPMSLRAGSLQVTLDKNAEVIVAGENNSPLAWRYSFGKGKIMVLNSGLLTNAKFCGVLMQLTSLLNDYFITTVFNAKVVFIDDFPFPIPEGTDYFVSSNYEGRNYEEFYKEIWWPQIKELAVKHKLKYTCLVLADQDNSTAMPPVKVSERTKELIGYYGKDIMKTGHELGIHGYNNASLVMADPSAGNSKAPPPYPLWKSAQDMETGLICLEKMLSETLGKMEYFTYVPPMNMLSKEGKKALLNVFPGIRCFGGIASLNSDAAVKRGGILYQEAGMDPDFPEVYDLPRNSYGELYKPEEIWRAYNYIAYYGLFSHFFHSDDLMDNERSANMDWRQLHDSLDKIMGDVSVKFPFLRAMTAKEFVLERFRTDKIKVYSSRKGNEITVVYENGDGPLYHYLRINNGMKIREIKNGTCRPVDAEGGLYLLEGLKSPLQITLE
jgi:hypothetical protein